MNMKAFLTATLLTCFGVSANAGTVSLVWDADAFEFQSYVISGLGELKFGGIPFLEEGRLLNAGVGDLAGLTTGVIASLSFLRSVACSFWLSQALR